jgi:predicted GH43/DUF377 family glycosyl hydrolase
MEIEKTTIILKPDPKKVQLRSFEPATEVQRTNIITRILNLSEDEAEKEFEKINRDFGNRHRNIKEFFLRRFNQVAKYVDDSSALSRIKQMLIGASLSMEYAIESTALFNPAVVWHPDQSHLPTGSKRFILSLRAVGEGHVSSIVFREGILDSENNISLEEPGIFVTPPEVVTNLNYDKVVFQRKIVETDLVGALADNVLDRLDNTFLYNELEKLLDSTLANSQFYNERNRLIIDEILSSSCSDYEIFYTQDIPLSERIIFPRSMAESNGIEDARFVRFDDEDGSIRYYATYTAYNGSKIQSHLLETEDFLHFKIRKFSGSEAKNKGMALFPKKINGMYAMLSRQDNENNFIMFSDDLYSWNSKKLISKPVFPWEIVQSGNCGSPIETEKGWLVLTHGVGPVRKYCISAMLLDKDDPSKVIGRLKEPLLSADEKEREGYVPNVVYTCGSIINGNMLIIPYAMSDYNSSFAKVNLSKLLNELTPR